MKLKYYMRGLGIGILITTIVLSIGGKKEKLTDKEIMVRAGELGMVMKEEDDKLEEVLEQSLEKGEQGMDLTEDNVLDEVSDLDEDNKEIDTDSGIDTDSDINVGSDEDTSTDTDNDTGIDFDTDTGIDSDTDTHTDNDNESDFVNSPDESDIDTDEDTDNDKYLDIDEDSEADSSRDTDIEVNDMSQEDDEGENQEPVEDDSAAQTQITFTIVRGMSSRQVSELLAEKGLIDNAVDFDNYIKRQGKASVIRIGTYTLPKASTYQVILNAIAG